MANQPPVPRGAAIYLLSLGNNLHELPKGSHKNLAKFRGDGKISPKEHIDALFVACGVLGVQEEDVVAKLFEKYLVDVATQWFYQLPHGSIKNWATMRNKFESRFKSANADLSLISQVIQLKKEESEPMREFVAKFNRLVR